MNHSHSFKQCYEILNIQSDSDWNTAKKSYRKLIQKWHPDRQSDPEEKLQATNKIKDLTTAYSQLSDYYRQNGELPLNKQPKPIIEESKTDTEKSVKKTDNDDLSKTNPSQQKEPPSDYTIKNKTHKSAIVLSIIVVSLLVIIYQNIDIALEQIERDIDSPAKAPNAISKKQKTIKDSHKKIVKKNAVREKYFSYGSSITEVITVQGPPDKTNGNIWYYGKSEVHFIDGKVSYWFRSADRPLKAIMIKQKPEKTNKKNLKSQLLQY